ncbi:hypothetical protein BDD14_1380 [Edaphobacter modestus]|uniref:Uncharacterized protein n=1 Tax=Edaphobacter modestus TaxID=388466 RepID=A0A4Q7YR71_9BACT|nr:hypothetical protein BDD14_1380 [Edaphobacter modestus]
MFANNMHKLTASPYEESLGNDHSLQNAEWVLGLQY